MQIRSISILIYFLCFQCIRSFAQEKPNIIIFLVDDMGWQDCSVPFWKEKTQSNYIYETPNLEKLALRGIKFSSAYTNSVCTPTRVSLMTGMNVARHNVTNWTNVLKDKTTDYPDSILNPPHWNINGLSTVNGINNTIVANTLPQILKKAGYYTIHCGKGHFGPYGTPGANPRNIGFDENIAGTAAGHPGSFLAEDGYKSNINDTLWNVRDLDQYIKNGEFLTDALTKAAIHSVENARQKKQPFFLYLSQYAVHLPFNKDKRYYEKYIKKGLNDAEAKYAGLIEGIDKSLGEIMQYLEKIGATKNTYILFLSDNGGLSLSPPRNPPAHRQNYPLKMGKGSLYEGGIRIPMIIAGPGIPTNQTRNQYISVDDIFPTILEWADIKNINLKQHLDGFSINSWIEDKDKINNERALIWHYPNNWTNINLHGISWQSAIRIGDWKLIYFHKEEKLELYNIHKDINEDFDIALKMPEKLNSMAKQMTIILKERGATLPTYKNTGRMIPWPDEIADRMLK
ncbi:MAG: sulfatase [Chitinophagaceae bacterium]